VTVGRPWASALKESRGGFRVAKRKTVSLIGANENPAVLSKAGREREINRRKGAHLSNWKGGWPVR